MTLRNLYIQIIIFLMPVACFSQNRVRVSIQKNSKTYPDKNYFFAKITDMRADQRDLGLIYKPDRRTLCRADFKGTLPEEIFKFLKSVYPNSKSSNQILIAVNAFEIGHILAKTDSGFVKLNLDFYLLRNDSVSFISHYEHTLCEGAVEVAMSHPNRIKRALLTATVDMEKNLNHGGPAEYQAASNVSAKSAIQTEKSLPQNSTSYSYNEKLKRSEDTLKTKGYPARIIWLIAGHIGATPDYLLPGLNFDCLFRFKKRPRWLVGPNANFSLIKFLNKDALEGYESFNLYYSDFGLRLLRQIKSIAFFNFNSHFMLGHEEIKYRSAYYFDPKITKTSANSTSPDYSDLFYGFKFETGIYLLSPGESSAFIGVDLILMGTSSLILEDGAGIKVTIGFKI